MTLRYKIFGKPKDLSDLVDFARKKGRRFAEVRISTNVLEDLRFINPVKIDKALYEITVNCGNASIVAGSVVGTSMGLHRFGNLGEAKEVTEYVKKMAKDVAMHLERSGIVATYDRVLPPLPGRHSYSF